MWSNHATGEADRPANAGRSNSARRKSKKPRARPRPCRLQLETLEDRRVLSADFDLAMALGSTGSDVGNAVATDNAGNIYITGRFSGTVDFDPGAGTTNLVSAGGDDAFVAKYTSAGGLVWARQFGGTLNEQGLAIAVDSAGNVYTTGEYSGTVDFDPGPGTYSLGNAGSTDVFISKLDADGNFAWARRIGSSGGDQGLGIAVDSSGNVVTTGRFINTVDFDPDPVAEHKLSAAGNSDIFISKLDAAGKFVWARRMGSSEVDAGFGVAIGPDDSIYTTGTFVGTVDFDPGPGTYSLVSSGQDVFVSQLDAAGNFVQAVRMGGSGSDQGNGIDVDSAGNVYVTGSFNGSNADFDPGPDVFTLVSNGVQDAFVTKLDAAMALVWARQFGGAGTDIGNGIAVDGAGNVYATGRFSGTVDFDPGSGTFNLVSAGGNEVFVSKLDSQGHFVLAKQLGGTSNDAGLGIATDGTVGHVYVTGSFEGTADFDPGSGTHNLVSAGSLDAFVWKLKRNQAPTDVSLSNDTVPENSPNGTLVGTLSTSDVDGGDSHAYTLLDDAGGRFTLSGDQLLVADGSLLDFEASSSHQVLVRTTDLGGSSFDRVLTITVEDVNEQPVVDAGGDEELAEGSTLVHVVSFTDPEPSGWTATVDYGDGTVESLSLAAQGSFSVSHVYADDGSYTVTVSVTDAGGAQGTDSFQVTVLNVAPTVGWIAGPSSGVPGRMLGFSAAFNDPGQADAHVTLWEVFDGSSVQVGSGSGTTLDLALDQAGNYTVVFTVTDDGGGWDSASRSLSVTEATPVAVVVDPLDASRQMLLIHGTDQDDQILVDYQGYGGSDGDSDGDDDQTTAGWYDVTINGVSMGSFAADEGYSLSRIVVFGLEGGDDLEIAGSVGLSGWLFGGAGNDRLKGGGGHDLLFGGDGDDVMIGGGGRDFMVGGDGADRLVGNAGDDILIAGSTVYDDDEAALLALTHEWQRTDLTYAQRVQLLEQGVGADESIRLDSSTVEHDSSVDMLTGSSGLDWFWHEFDKDTATDQQDEIVSGHSGGGWIITLYTNILGRAPSLEEWNNWVKAVNRGVTFKQVAEAFMYSRERRGQIIDGLYRQYLGRAADNAGIDFWIGVWNANGGPEHVQAGIIGSREFYRFSGNTDAGWVKALYKNVLGREVDEAGLKHWVKYIRSHSKQSVVLGFVTSDEYRLDMVKSWFHEYLGRTLDKGGAQYWLQQMKRGTSQESIQIGICSSAEYRSPV